MGSCFSSESRNPLPSSPTTTLGIKKRKNSKKRPPGLRNSSSFDHRRDEQLHRIADRMFLNGSSEVASLFTQQGKKGINQDAMIVWEMQIHLQRLQMVCPMQMYFGKGITTELKIVQSVL